MNKLSRTLPLVLGAVALVSAHASAAAPAADPWPAEVPAQINFVDTENDGTGRHAPETAATAGFGELAADELGASHLASNDRAPTDKSGSASPGMH